MSMTAANDRAHAGIDGAYLDMLEAVTCCDYDAALTRLDHLEDLLRAHMRFEESQILPRLAEADPRIAELVDADHRIIERRLRHARDALTGLHAEAADRRRMVQSLARILGLRATLEHHSEREQSLAYPRLDAVLPPALATALAGELVRTAEHAGDTGD